MAPTPSSQRSHALSYSQIASLRAIIDGLLPPLVVPPDEERAEDNQRYYGHRLSADPAFLAALVKSIDAKLDKHESFLLKGLLSALSTSIGTSLLFGVATVHPFPEWPVSEQTQLLQRLQHSSIHQRRQIFNGLKRLICGLAYSYTPNPFWEAMGYPGPPQHWLEDDAERVAQASQQQHGIQQALLRVNQDSEITCDVVIVGSGAGGSVAASVCAAAGYKVLVLEKGSYLPPHEISNLEADALDKMYESHGLLTTRDGGIMILAGSTLGGGTTINWSCCLPLPDYVRKEWADQYGLKDFRVGGDFDRATRAVLKRIGAMNKYNVTHNAMNTKLQEGCDALGYRWDTTRQNLKSTEVDTAGYICFGDRYGNKNSALTTYLQDAVRHGAKIIDRCRVDRLLKSQDGKRATGVQCQVKGHRLTVKARKCVVIAAGALQTPCLLQRSGFRNRHIGKHLHLHPVTTSVAYMESSKNIDCFLGAPLTTVCKAFAMGPANDGYGAMIETPSAHPGIAGAGFPWTTPVQFKKRLRRFRNAYPFIVIQRDSGEGTVKAGRQGCNPGIDYVVSEADKESLARALQGCLLLSIASGAREVSSCHIRDPGLRISGGASDDTSLVDYVANVTSFGLKEHEVGLFSAHQMGSCRMSVSPALGVVDTNGEAWECDDLYIMDASVFPTASGVNPMVTILAISYMLSLKLAMRMRHNDEKLTKASEISLATELAKQRTELRSIPNEQIDWRAVIELVLQVVLWVVILGPILSAWFLDNPPWFS